MPKISVIMPIYNGERFVAQAIESMLHQTFSDFELILVDDASTDKTLEILKVYGKKDARVRVLENAENMGLTKSLNRGIEAAAGAYIARMDADDVCHKDRFRQQSAFLDEHAEYGLVGSWYIKIDEKGKELWNEKIPIKDQDLKRELIKRNPFPHASFMMRRSALDRVGLYDETWKVTQDYELLFRISHAYKIGVVPEFLLYSRLTLSGITSTRNREQIFFALRAKARAIQRGQYSFFAYVFFLFPLVLLLVPVAVRRFLKKFFL